MEGRLDGCPGRVLNIAFVLDGIQTSYLVHIYLLAIAICGITGCYGHLVTMLCLFFYQSLRTDHKARGGGVGTICLRRDSFLLTLP